MDKQNINPQSADNSNLANAAKTSKPKTGLDEWNDRLDHNLEPQGTNDVQADENAEDFQDKADENARPA